MPQPGFIKRLGYKAVPIRPRREQRIGTAVRVYNPVYVQNQLRALLKRFGIK